ncbi:MAG: AAA family ATPase [Acidimicrobiia bacterium]
MTNIHSDFVTPKTKPILPGFYIVVSGGPGSGKTLLARPVAEALRLPLLSKDTIKEALFDELGIGDRLWSRRLGRASVAVLYRIAANTPAAVLESVFHHDLAVADLQALEKPLIELHCQCDKEVALQRFEERATDERHPGHLDSQQPRNRLVELVEEGLEPLRLGGPLLEVNTNNRVDVAQVVDWIKAQPEYQKTLDL